MGTLRGPYLQHMLTITSTSFSDMVIIGEHVETCTKAGTIQGIPNNTNNNIGIGRKPFSGFIKKKEGETSVVTINQGKDLAYPQVRFPYFPTLVVIPNLYVPQVYVTTTPAPWMTKQRLFAPQLQYLPHKKFAPPLNYQQQNQQPQGPRAPQIQRAPKRRFDPIPMSYAQLLPQLLTISWFNYMNLVHHLILSPGGMTLMLIINLILEPQATRLRIVENLNVKFKTSSMQRP